MSDWLSKYRREIEYCSYCPKLCRFACPVAEAERSETLTPTGKQTVLKLVNDGLLPFDAAAAEPLFMCTGCLISRTYCEHDIEVYPPFEAARREAVRRGVAPAKAMAFEGAWQKRGNPFGADLATKLEGLLPPERLTRGGKVVFFTGCTALHYFPEQVADAARVLEALRLDWRAFSAEHLCCGQPLLALGHEDAFKKQARETAAALAGAELVVTPCPTCAHVLQDRYPEFGAEISARVVPLVALAAERLSQLLIVRRDPRSVGYHDPCHLGRYLGMYEEPRRVLAATLEGPLVEFPENRDRSVCCGGGGGLPVTRPDTARAIAGDRVADARASGAEVVATACPMCRRMLGRTGRDAGVIAEDVVSILARGLQ